jgi:hypothetical protein
MASIGCGSATIASIRPTRRNSTSTRDRTVRSAADSLATSVGPDQGVDSFFTLLPGVPALTFSLLAYLALSMTQASHDIQAVPEVKMDVRGRKCRIFDAAGNQTAYQYTTNPPGRSST